MEKFISAAMQCDSPCQLCALVIACITVLAVTGMLCLVAFKLLDTLNAFKKVSVKTERDSINVEFNKE